MFPPFLELLPREFVAVLFYEELSAVLEFEYVVDKALPDDKGLVVVYHATNDISA